jgi:endonuclease-3
MKRSERYAAFVAHFAAIMPEAETELVYRNPYELLVSVILSAQCTDKRVNLVTPALFEAYPDFAHLAEVDAETIFPYIRSISYPNNKAKHLAGMAQKVMHDFHGVLPLEVDKLVTLPGVGRKTANVIVSVLDQQSAMAVDTHVNRVSKRIGLVPESASTPLAVEKVLIKHLPSEVVHLSHHWLILHGRYVCTARSPKCAECAIISFCKTGPKLLNKS